MTPAMSRLTRERIMVTIDSSCQGMVMASSFWAENVVVLDNVPWFHDITLLHICQ